MPKAEVEIKRSDFPKDRKDFIFGGGTSAYQVEGAWDVGGKGRSIWDRFTRHSPGRILDGGNGCIATNHYNMFKDDVALMKKVGLDAYKFSISWSRILPGGKLCGGISEEGIKYYNDLIDALLAEGIEPWATLFHWDLPQCLEDEHRGFLSKDIVNDFCDFAEVCFWKFGDRVKNWITLNEPWTYTYHGYVTGFFPPGRGGEYTESAEPGKDGKTKWKLERKAKLAHRSPVVKHPVKELEDENVQKNEIRKRAYEAKQENQRIILDNKQYPAKGDPGTEPYIVAHNLILAHAHAVKVYRSKYQALQGGKIGITNVSTWFYPHNKDSQEDREAVWRALDFMLGWFLGPLIFGHYPETMTNIVKDRLPTFEELEVKLVKGSYDFLGINYYTTYYAKNKTIAPAGSSQKHYSDDVQVEQHYERNNEPIGTQGASDWLYVVPEGIKHLMVYIKENYNDPVIYITENGVDRKKKRTTVTEARDDHKERATYFQEHLKCLKGAMEEGVRLKGYFISSLLDGFEWAQGYAARFGIFYVDFANGRHTRFPKRSANWWIKFLEKPMISWDNKLPYSSEVLKKLLPGKAEEEEYDISATKLRVPTTNTSINFLYN